MVQSGTWWFSQWPNGSIWYLMVQSLAWWFNLVPDGSVSGLMVQSGTRWFSQWPDGSIWYLMVQSVAWCRMKSVSELISEASAWAEVPATSNSISSPVKKCVSLWDTVSDVKATIAWDGFFGHWILSRIEGKDLKFFSCCAIIFWVRARFNSFNA
jgi:hypothetical protein